MKAAVIVYPGSNCDRDAMVALEQATGRPPVVVWHRETELPPVDLVVVPGGFTYGDYLRVGAMAARSPIMADVVRRAKKGLHVLGICNGFQILTETGLLPGALMRNATLKFVCRDAHLRVERNDSPFTSGYKKGQVVRFPVAHMDGNFFADDDMLKRIEGEGQVAFRYCDAKGDLSSEANFNGSRSSIAGIFNSTRTILGMMPHPERLADAMLGGIDGKPMFDSLVATFH